MTQRVSRVFALVASLPLIVVGLLRAEVNPCESRVIINPRDPEEFRRTGADLLEKVSRNTGLPLPRLREIGAGKFLIEATTPGHSTKLLSALQSYLPLFESMRRDVQLRLDAIPNDEKWPQWNLKRIGTPAAWDSVTDSAEVVVAVLDSGVDAAHPDLAPNAH